eukprot:3302662-Prymnesium_polylepis.1
MSIEHGAGDGVRPERGSSGVHAVCLKSGLIRAEARLIRSDVFSQLGHIGPSRSGVQTPINQRSIEKSRIPESVSGTASDSGTLSMRSQLISRVLELT